jgi:hypothetical protein
MIAIVKMRINITGIEPIIVPALARPLPFKEGSFLIFLNDIIPSTKGAQKRMRRSINIGMDHTFPPVPRPVKVSRKSVTYK